MNNRSNDNGKVIGGLILIGIGAAFLLRNLGAGIPNWLFSWPMILIAVGIYTGAKHNFRNASAFVLIAIGGFFLVSRFIPEFRADRFIVPAVLIGVGIMFILRPQGRRISRETSATVTDTDATNSYQASGVTVLPDESDFIKVSSIFSGVNRRVLSKNFQGAQVTSVFGGSEIDLSQADVQSPVVIKCEVAFGGITIIVPPHWSVQNEVDGLFHGVEDKRRSHLTAGVDMQKMIILRGSVFFGGIDVKSY